MEDSSDSADFIGSIYESATSREEKSTILESLVIMDDAEGLAL